MSKNKDTVTSGKAELGLPNREEEREENEIDFKDIVQGLNHPLDLEKDVLTPPNATNLPDVVKIANEGQSSSAVSSVVGKLIDPGKIGIISHNGFIKIVGPGRYYLPNPRAGWGDVQSLTEDYINYESFSFVRVQRGQVGLAHHNGQPLLLAEGLHVRNDRLFEFVEAQDVNQQYLQHGSIHVIRVPKGSYGLVTEENIPKLLPEGVHVTNSNVFKFDGMQSMNQPYIKHGTLHILRIPKGKVALVSDDNKPKLLEGTHYINSKTFTYNKMEDINQPVIKNGTISQFRVRKGELGLAWENNQPSFFEEGIYLKDNPQFVFDKCVSASAKEINFGSKKIITVYDGEVGVSYNKGRLIVLKPDRHLIDNAEHVFQGFISTQQQCIHLTDSKYEKEGMLSCSTKDFVEIGLKADVFFKIADAEKVLLIVGKDKVNILVKDTAVATLNSIIRSTSLAEVAQNKEVAAKSAKQVEVEDDGKQKPMFFDKVHDEFISKLHDSFMDQFGISITNIRIESFKILDEQLSTNISKQAFTTAQTETTLSNLAGQTEIATAQMKRDAEVNRIQAEGQAIKLRTETEAKNNAVMESARANADATVIKAKADAEAVQLKAQAEAKAIILKAEAEAKQAEMLNATPLGGQIQMYQLYSQMVKSSMTGVSKLIYMPTEAMNNPLSFMNMQQGQGLIPGFSPSSAKK